MDRCQSANAGAGHAGSQPDGHPDTDRCHAHADVGIGYPTRFVEKVMGSCERDGLSRRPRRLRRKQHLARARYRDVSLRRRQGRTNHRRRTGPQSVHDRSDGGVLRDPERAAGPRVDRLWSRCIDRITLIQCIGKLDLDGQSEPWHDIGTRSVKLMRYSPAA